MLLIDDGDNGDAYSIKLLNFLLRFLVLPGTEN